MARPRKPETARAPSRLDAALLERIEAWRLAQPGASTKTAAIERLIERGLSASPEPIE